MTPFGHVSSTFYGRHKPWKTALFILAVCFSIGSAIGKAWALLAFLLIDADDRVLFERRPPTGIWGGLLGLPEYADIETLKTALLASAETPSEPS